MMLWCLRGPDGLIEQTVDTDRHQCWVRSYDYLARWDSEFGVRYWKKWETSIRAAKKLGFVMVRCDLVERAPKGAGSGEQIK